MCVAVVSSVAVGARALADKVSRALDEQSGLGRRQLASLELIDSMLSDITRAVTSHDANTRRVREVLSALSETAERHEEAVVELSGVADRLGGRSRALADRVNRFKI
jgi:methyl-accepting chemotaxis protein